jgi:hypothetical protein
MLLMAANRMLYAVCWRIYTGTVQQEYSQSRRFLDFGGFFHWTR